MSKFNPVVMVVEDENLLLEAITKKLEINGLHPIPNSGGEVAFEYLKSHPVLPDVIWLDYNLQDMDGLQFMARLQDNPDWAEIPVLVVSNSASVDNVNAMLSKGAKRYFLKDKHRLDDIVNMVKEFIEKDEKEHV